MAPPPWLSLLESIADRADEIALRHFRRQGLRVEEKPDLSPVTEADQAIEESARALLRQRHPGLGLLGEEFGAQARIFALNYWLEIRPDIDPNEVASELRFAIEDKFLQAGWKVLPAA